jgi:hypothetical protein
MVAFCRILVLFHAACRHADGGPLLPPARPRAPTRARAQRPQRKHAGPMHRRPTGRCAGAPQADARAPHGRCTARLRAAWTLRGGDERAARARRRRRARRPARRGERDRPSTKRPQSSAALNLSADAADKGRSRGSPHIAGQVQATGSPETPNQQLRRGLRQCPRVQCSQATAANSSSRARRPHATWVFRSRRFVAGPTPGTSAATARPGASAALRAHSSTTSSARCTVTDPRHGRTAPSTGSPTRAPPSTPAFASPERSKTRSAHAPAA